MRIIEISNTLEGKKRLPIDDRRDCPTHKYGDRMNRTPKTCPGILTANDNHGSRLFTVRHEYRP